MGFQGQLGSVQLADLFQTMFVNRQTGTLTVTPVDGAPVRIYFHQGLIALCSSPVVGGMPFLISTLTRKGLIASDRAKDLHQRMSSSGQPLRELFLSANVLPPADLDEISAWCAEEIICPLFELHDGEFAFVDGDPVAELMAPDAIEPAPPGLSTQQLIMEATRRADEWQRIREVIPDNETLFVVDNEGRANLRSVQTDPEMLKVLRYLNGRHTIDAIAEAVGATRFDTHAIIAQMVLAGVARPQSIQDVVGDAAQLRSTGELAKASELLELALAQTRLPEVIRPLADIYAQLGQAARAVELYLELIQLSQDSGDLEQALTDLDTVVALSPEDPELHFERAQVLAELGQQEPAANGYVIAAQAFLGTRDVARAIDACQRARQLAPRAAAPHRHLARAHLMEGRTDDAVTEYKSLWHALLTVNTPTKALDELRSLLESDCKFPAIKSQIIDHARNSEAVRTSRALRLLAQALLAAMVIAGLGVGWNLYSKVYARNQGKDLIARLDGEVGKRMELIQHATLLEDVGELRRRFGSDNELRPTIDQLESRIRSDFESRGRNLLARGNGQIERGDFSAAEATFKELASRYQGSEAGTMAASMLEKVHAERIRAQVQVELTAAEERWNGLEWDAALDALGKILQRRDLPAATQARLAQKQVEWNNALHSSKLLLERAQRTEAAGDQRAAINAYRRASAAGGEPHAGQARDRQRSLELAYGRLLANQVREQGMKGDDARAFVAYDDLLKLANEASGDGVRDLISNLSIPYTVVVDHPHTVLTIRRASEDIVVKAPPGTKGQWRHQFTYGPGDNLTLTASRPGFGAISGAVNVAARRCSGVVQLQRGPRWKADLSAPATTSSVFAGAQVLVGTGRWTIDIVDVRTGTTRSVPFPEAVGEFRQPPVVFQGRAYVVLDDTMHVVDLATRSQVWQWTSDDQRLTGPLLVSEHDLIQGALLITAGSVRNGYSMIVSDGSGKISPVPFRSGEESSALPGMDRSSGRSLLYLGFNGELRVLDASAATGQSPPRVLYTKSLDAGSIVGRPIHAEVGPNHRPAVLLSVTGNTGMVLAIDADPEVPESRRVLGTWPIQGTLPSTPTIDGRTAMVSVGEGIVYALDLDQPGVQRWRFPEKGYIGANPGEVGIGQRGYYVAGGDGIMHCIDRTSGAERWRCDLGAPTSGSLTTGDGMVFVPVRSGKLWGFDEGEE